MQITNRLKNQHLLWRSAFGPMAENAASWMTFLKKNCGSSCLKPPLRKPEKIVVAQNLVDGLVNGVQDLAMQNEVSKAEAAKKRRQQSREEIKNLNLIWLDEMINSEAQLREKLSLFWHGQFACRVINSYFQQDLLH
jgi:hypothetical protein